MSDEEEREDLRNAWFDRSEQIDVWSSTASRPVHVLFESAINTAIAWWKQREPYRYTVPDAGAEAYIWPRGDAHSAQPAQNAIQQWSDTSQEYHWKKPPAATSYSPIDYAAPQTPIAMFHWIPPPQILHWPDSAAPHFDTLRGYEPVKVASLTDYQPMDSNLHEIPDYSIHQSQVNLVVQQMSAFGSLDVMANLPASTAQTNPDMFTIIHGGQP
jgi:hypothetical protein